MPAPTLPNAVRAASAVRARGEAILALLRIEPVADPPTLADVIVPSEAGAFGPELRAGLEALLRAVADRSSDQAAAVASRLVGLGPGRTPLGDDYLAAAAVTVARFGEPAGFATQARQRWLSALLPRRLLSLTTATSAHLIIDAVRGVAPAPVASLLRLRTDDLRLTLAIARLEATGASSGHGWAASLGATAILLCVTNDHE